MKLTTTTQVSVDGVMQGNGRIILQVYRPGGRPRYATDVPAPGVPENS